LSEIYLHAIVDACPVGITNRLLMHSELERFPNENAMLSLSVTEVVATPLQKSGPLVEVDSDRAPKKYGKVRTCRPGGTHVVCGVDWVMILGTGH
jgi:hypothetical protein